jgi:polysulfide reductase chain C
MIDDLLFLPQRGPHWDWKVAADLFFGGAGVGALLFAIAIHHAYRERYRRICTTAATLAPILVVIGLLSLFSKLGRPMSVWQALVHVAPTSPLWWGGILQVVLLAGGVVYAALWWRPTNENYGKRAVLGALLAPVAFAVGLYHGTLLALNPSRPLWNHGPAVVTAGFAFVATGIAAVMIVHLGRVIVVEGYLDRFLSDLAPIRNLLLAALLAQSATAFVWWIDLRFSSVDSRAALEAATLSHGTLFWVGGVGAGLLAPLFLYLVSLHSAARHRLRQVGVIAVTSALILGGGFCFRLAVVLAGQLPATTSPLQ